MFNTIKQYKDMTLSPYSIKQFTKNLIPTFESQRLNSQFATIILCSQKDLESQLTEVKFSPSNQFDNPILDSNKKWMPQDVREYDNYLASRPSADRRTHAERFLLENLDNLFYAFNYKHKETPSIILLYTWITPCSNCTKLIKDKLCAPPYKRIPKVVVYTTNTRVRGDTVEDVEEAKESLRKAGIRVQRVWHEKLN